jgi:hypothetical protein
MHSVPKFTGPVHGPRSQDGRRCTDLASSRGRIQSFGNHETADMPDDPTEQNAEAMMFALFDDHVQ